MYDSHIIIVNMAISRLLRTRYFRLLTSDADEIVLFPTTCLHAVEGTCPAAIGVYCTGRGGGGNKDAKT